MATAIATAKTLIIDNREAALCAAINIPYDIKQLHVGDIHIGNVTKPALVLERKTFADFEASIMDKRYREQRGRLLAFGAEVGARIGYILEGTSSSVGPQTIGDSLFVRATTTATASKPRISHAAIMKMVSRLMYRHGIPVFRTLNVNDTADLVQNLHAQWSDDNEVFNSENLVQRGIEGIQVVKKNNSEDPVIFGTSMLCLVTGVSPRIAEAWLTAYGSAGEVIKAPMKNLADVKVGTRRVGDAVATRAVNLWTSIGLRS